jgi:hypothetical protein
MSQHGVGEAGKPELKTEAIEQTSGSINAPAACTTMLFYVLLKSP